MKYEIVRLQGGVTTARQIPHPNNPLVLVSVYPIRYLEAGPWGAANSMGGYIASERNLDQSGDCWVGSNAVVFDKARIAGNAHVQGIGTEDENLVLIFDSAVIAGNAEVKCRAWVFGNARVLEKSVVSGSARIFGDARIYGRASIAESVSVSGNARVSGEASLWGSVLLLDDARVYGTARLSGTVQMENNSRIFGNAKIHGTGIHAPLLQIKDNARVSGCAVVKDEEKEVSLTGNATIYGTLEITGGDVTGRSLVTGCPDEEDVADCPEAPAGQPTADCPPA